MKINTMTDKPQKEKKANYVPRITQLDANEFDKEIQKLLSAELLKISNYLKLGALNNLKLEINLLLNLLIFYHSIPYSNSTFGQQLLCLKYTNKFSRTHVIIYTIMNYLLPYFKNKCEDQSNQTSIVRKIEVIVKSVQFLNLLIFIREGKYPTIVDRILKLTYSPVDKLSRNVGYNFMTRELLWHGFMELLVYILPLINYKTIKRKIKKTFLITSHPVKKEKNIMFNTDTKCVVCDDFPTLPCQISVFCPHLACYYCVKSNILADEKFICPVCSETNTASEHLKFLQG